MVGFFFFVKNYLLLYVNGVGEMVIIYVKYNMLKIWLVGGLVEFCLELFMINLIIYCLSGFWFGRNLVF